MPLPNLPTFRNESNKSDDNVDYFNKISAKIKNNPAPVPAPVPVQKEEQGFAADMVDKFQEGFYNTTGSIGTGIRGMTTDTQEPWNWEASQYKAAQDQAKTLSTAQKEADAKLGFDEEDELNTLNVGGLISSGMGSLLPSMIGGGVPGAVLKKGATLLAPAATTAQKVAQGIGYGAGGAVQIGGSSKNQVEEEIGRMSPDNLMMMPDFKAMVDSGIPFDQARKQFGYDQSQKGLTQGGILGAVSMGTLGPVLERIVMGSLGKTGVQKFLGGAATEGGQEFIEEGGQQRIANPLTGKPDWEGVLEAGGLGAIGGAGAGGIAGGAGAMIPQPRKPDDIPIKDDQGNIISYRDQQTGEKYSPIDMSQGLGLPRSDINTKPAEQILPEIQTPSYGRGGTPDTIQNQMPLGPDEIPSTVQHPTNNKIVPDTGSLSDALNASAALVPTGQAEQAEQAEQALEPAPLEGEVMGGELATQGETGQPELELDAIEGEFIELQEGEQQIQMALEQGVITPQEATNSFQYVENRRAELNAQFQEFQSRTAQQNKLDKKAAPIGPFENDTKPIGQNQNGENIYQDENGKRYIKGVEGAKGNNKQYEMDDFRGNRFQTPDEVKAGRDKKELTPEEEKHLFGDTKVEWTKDERIDHFLMDDKPFLQKSKRKTLNRIPNNEELNEYGGSRGEVIKNIIEGGGKVILRNGERILTTKDGKSFTQEQVTKTAMDFAEDMQGEFATEEDAAPEPETAKTPFMDKTDIPNIDDVVDNPEYFRKNKGVEVTDEVMSPDEYIKRSVKGFKSTDEKTMRGRDRGLINRYADDMKKGDKFPMISLDYSGGRFNQEGIHRALAAKEAGINEIPVRIKTDVKAKPEKKDTDVLDQLVEDFEPTVKDVPEVKTTKPRLQVETFVNPKGSNRIKVTGDTFALKDEIKAIGGASWSRKFKAWTFPMSKEGAVRDFVNGLDTTDKPTVTQDDKLQPTVTKADNRLVKVGDMVQMGDNLRKVTAIPETSDGNIATHYMGRKNALGGFDRHEYTPGATVKITNFTKGEFTRLSGLMVEYPQTEAAPERDEQGRTDAQKEAGNYKKIHKQWNGLDIAIENAEGTKRSGTDEDGKAWEVTMENDYGYIKRTEGADGDHVDVFMGPNLTSDKVYVVNQSNPDGSFDEHKVLVGFNSAASAEKGYLANYENGWNNYGEIAETTVDGFKTWLKEDTQKKPAKFKETKGGGKKLVEDFLAGETDNAPTVEEFEAAEAANQEKYFTDKTNNIKNLTDKELRTELNKANDSEKISGDRRSQYEKDYREALIKESYERSGEEQISFDGEEAEAANYGKSNTIFTEDAAAKARELLKKKFGQLNAGIDPEILQAGLTLAGYHIEAGARKFGDFSKVMINDLGKGVEPYLRSWYESVRHYPGFDNKGMSSAAEIDAGPDTKEETKSPIDKFYEDIKAGTGPTDLRQFRKWMNNNGMDGTDTLQVKKAQEYYEAAQVRVARDIVNEKGTRKATYNKLVELYKNQPVLHAATSTSVANQAFSTPAPIAYMSSELAGINKQTTVYEPTAGNGMLLMAADPKKSTVNELEPLRGENLTANGFRVTNNDATNYLPQKEHDVMIANPPFGNLGRGNEVKVDGYIIREIDHVIAAKALKAIKDDGSATIIIGASKNENTRKPNDKLFFNWLYSNYNVTDHFEINGDLYRRQGAGWPIAVITVKGRNDNKAILPIKEGDVKRLNTWDEIYEHGNEMVGSNKLIGQNFTGTVSGQNIKTPKKPKSGSVSGQAGNKVSRPDKQGKSEPTPNGDTGTTDGSTGIRTGPIGDNGSTVEQDKLDNRANQVTGGYSGATDQAERNDNGEHNNNPTKLNKIQTDYVTGSKGLNEEIYTPTGLAEATQHALKQLKQQVGDLDKYVQSELGYESEADLFDAFMGLQVDGVAMTINNLKKNKGMIIADQTGVGKGRQAAAIIRWAIKNGKTPIFMTEKPNLFTDIYNDLADIGTNDVKPFILNQTEAINKKDANENITRIFNTGVSKYTKVVESKKLPPETNALFSTYSQIQYAGNKQQAMIAQMVKDDDVIFILDESHNVGGMDSNRGKFMDDMLRTTPNGALYLSATFAKRPDNMPIYFRTDIGDATDSKEGLVDAISGGGVLMQTVVSNQLAQSGQLIRREKSFEGIEIKSVTIGKDDPTEIKRQEKLADGFTTILRGITSADKSFHTGYVAYLKKQVGDGKQAHYIPGTEITSLNVQSVASGVDHTNFTSVVHNKIKELLFVAKAEEAGRLAIASIKAGRKPIIAVDNTLETFLKDYATQHGIAIDGSLGDLSFKDILQKSLDRSRRLRIVLPTGEKEVIPIPLADLDKATRQAYEQAQRLIDAMDTTGLPVSPIDMIRHTIEKAGYSVKEITGRVSGIDYNDMTLKDIPESGSNNRFTTVDEFNTGKIDAIILNQAGATGLSLHSSKKLKPNQRQQREMIVAQPSLDINTFMQMLGRANRTGQENKPKIKLLALNIPAEIRPNAILSNKMKSLNANTSSDTKSNTSVKSADIMNKYGNEVVAEYLRENPSLRARLDVNLDSEDIIQSVTGRLAILPVKRQKEFYDVVQEQYNEYIEQLNKMNRNDLEKKVVDLQAKELTTDILYPGKKPGSIFGGNAYIGEYEVQKQGFPPTTNEVIDIIDDFSKGQSPSVIKENILAEKEKQAAAHIAKLTEADNNETTIGVGSKNRVPDFHKTKRATEREFDTFTIGQVVNLKIEGEPMKGVVTGIKNTHKKGATGNPFAMSKTSVRFAVDNAYNSITVPMSKLTGDKSIFDSKDWRSSITNVFDNAETSIATEKRFIVTNNLLQGYSKVGTGNVIQFTKEGGGTDVGILLPKTYTKNTDDMSWPVKDTAVVLKMITDGVELESALQGSSITRNSDGGLSINAGTSKARAASVIHDKTLLSLVRGNEFSKLGSNWRGNFSAENASRAIKRYMEIFPMTVNRKTADNYGLVENVKYSKDGKPVKGQTVQGLKKLLGDINDNVVIVSKQSQLPAGLQDDNTTIAGAYDPTTGKMYLVAENIDAKDSKSLLNHEAVHGVLRHTPAYKFALDALKRVKNTQAYKDAEQAAINAGTPANDMQEEILAYYIQHYPKAPIVARLISQIRQWLRKHFNIKLNMTEVADMVNAMARGDIQREYRLENGNVMFHAAYHGTPYEVTKFNTDKIREGEGGNAQGWGMYFAGEKGVAEHYSKLPKNKGKGNVYGVELKPSQHEYLLWEKPLTQQTKFVKDAIISMGMGSYISDEMTGEQFYNTVAGFHKVDPDANWMLDVSLPQKQASLELLNVGIRGNKYKDAAMRTGGKGDYNYVIFSEDDVDITAKYSKKQSQSGIRSKVNQARDKDTIGEMAGKFKENLANKLRQGMVDRFNQLFVNDKKLYGDDILANKDNFSLSAWQLAKASSSSQGSVHAMIDYGRIMMDKNGALDRRPGESKGIIQVLKQLGGGDEINDFMTWIAANRGEKLYLEGWNPLKGPKAEYTGGRENLFTWGEIQEGKSFNKGKEKLWNKVLGEFDQFRKDVLQISQQSGIISKETAEDFANEMYVPFYRVMTDEQISNGAIPGRKDAARLSRAEAYKKLKGGQQKIGDLLENTLLNYNHLLSASLKNNAASRALETASSPTVDVATQVPEKLAVTGKSTFILKDGEKVWYNVEDKLTYNALTSLTDLGMNHGLMKLMRSFKRVFTTATTASPQFITANFMRDSVHAAAIGKKTMSNNAMTGFLNFNDKNNNKQRMIASGGAFSFGHIYMDDPDAIKRQIDRDFRKANLLSEPKHIGDMVLKAWDNYQEVSNRSENANRMAIYEQALKDGKSHQQASFEARDLLDFSSRGEWAAIRVLTDIVPFLNARLQGLDVMTRKGIVPSIKSLMGKGTDSDKVIAKRFSIVTGAVMLASMALYMAYKDDEDFQKLEDWQRDTYWFFKIGDHKFFIPKPFEIGAMGTMAERTLEQMVDNKVTGEKFAERFKEMLMTTFAFNPTPQMIKPVYDVYANRDSFTGRNIETQAMQNLSPENRVRGGTTTLAKNTSSALQSLFGQDSGATISPVQVDFLIKNYLGWVGATASGFVDNLVNYGKRPEKYWHEYQPIKRFYKSGESNYSRYTTQFYDNMKEINRVYSDVKHLAQIKEYDKARELLNENKEKLLYRKLMNRVSKKLTAANKEIINIRASNLSQSDKRRRIDALQTYKNNLTSKFKDI